MTLSEEFLGRQRVLVIAPHPDDETLGCAGTIARVKALGGEVYVLVMSGGGIQQFGRGADGTRAAFVPGSTRAAEFDAAMTYLKVDGYEIAYPDDATHQRLDTLPLRDVVERLETGATFSLQAVRPTTVLLPAPSFNQDHAVTFRAAMAATRPSAPGARHLAPAVLAYDNTTAFWALPTEQFTPNVYVDISEHLETKLAALELHRSQLRPAPFHASPDGVRTEAAYRGGQVGVAAAEAFQALRLVL